LSALWHWGEAVEQLKGWIENQIGAW